MEEMENLGLQVTVDQMNILRLEVDTQLTTEVAWEKIKGKVKQKGGTSTSCQ